MADDNDKETPEDRPKGGIIEEGGEVVIIEKRAPMLEKMERPRPWPEPPPVAPPERPPESSEESRDNESGESEGEGE
jgi:hypothetical protein